ncbi:MAG TPA: ATP-binding protein [Desulfuromonadales bacterium]|nr:ATP-binding protein [Desulfuromonadales bacterium]
MKDLIEVDIKVPNHTRYLGMIGKIGEDIARTLKNYEGDREELAYHVNLVLTEAMSNAIRHACPSPSSSNGIHITISIIRNSLNIRVFDKGAGFDPETLPPPDFKGESEGGRGLYLINSVMDKVIYRKHKNGYVLEMIKRLN